MYTIQLHIVFISISIEIVNRRNPGEVVTGNFYLTNFSDLTAVDSKVKVKVRKKLQSCSYKSTALLQKYFRGVELRS